MFKLDKNTVSQFEKWGVKKIKIFFFSGGCSGTKVDIVTDDFEVDETIVILNNKLMSSQEWQNQHYPFDIYVEKKDFDKFENATITAIVKADHTGESTSRYIYSDETVLDRCGCGTSFSFEKKKPKINLEKLKTLKIDIQK